jgi:hypothetical protein
MKILISKVDREAICKYGIPFFSIPVPLLDHASLSRVRAEENSSMDLRLMALGAG